MKYKVKVLANKAKNSPYTILPSIYEASAETQEVWDYLLKMGASVCEVIIEKEPVPEIPARTLKVAMKVEDNVAKPATIKSKATLESNPKNQTQGDN